MRYSGDVAQTKLTINAPAYPDGNRHYEPDYDEHSCAHIRGEQACIAVVREKGETRIVGVYSDPRTAMDAARRMCPSWASPHVATRQIHRTKHPFPIA
ncbi:hypothetical protein [Salinibacter phage M31CR41-2]|uniref:Uncharacterized protein n=1 Tax=Salinibacter phage M31CR41-2 TaxID=2681614 RepID=A0A2I6UH50_9CAUD|nr:hypothetical protein FGG68_gp10 [Salinibacter phage M31CR41-2]AUO79313.1 hypothetical protein [Salinibacter phage M31CR41-2]